MRCPEEANLRAPESVVDVHLGYIRAGAELIETNTFGASRPKLAQHFLEEEFERVLSDASENDVVLIAGKGHENYQIIGTTKHHFDDVEEATKVLTARAAV